MIGPLDLDTLLNDLKNNKDWADKEYVDVALLCLAKEIKAIKESIEHTQIATEGLRTQVLDYLIKE